MQQAIAALLGEFYGTGAVSREHAFELVAGGGADELAGLRGKQRVDRPRVACV